MSGRIRRKFIPGQWPARPHGNDPECQLCGRPIPGPQQDAHHLVPRSCGGTRTVVIHSICHRQIHALFTEAELQRDYHTLAALTAHPAIADFVAWVRKKPPGFSGRSHKSARVRQQGRSSS